MAMQDQPIGFSQLRTLAAEATNGFFQPRVLFKANQQSWVKEMSRVS